MLPVAISRINTASGDGVVAVAEAAFWIALVAAANETLQLGTLFPEPQITKN